eukprot:GDKH01011617.1.p1 GENE.GDKH01011617.1~~GDKH01011617.1.p1  ORF type:complete len:218 (+),score=26.91 GDKH01011617.1:88-741(+)
MPPKQEEAYDVMGKVLLLGEAQVGKTCLLIRWVEKRFQPNYILTLGVDFKVKYLTANDDKNTKVKLQLWDTAGQERFKTLTPAYYRSAHCVALVYDISDRDSFEKIRGWIQQVDDLGSSDLQKVLVGNKIDLEDKRVVATEEGQKLADEFGLVFYETSAKSNTKVDALFQTLADLCAKRAVAGGYPADANASISIRPEAGPDEGGPSNRRPKQGCKC